jgi:hypothetical protein
MSGRLGTINKAAGPVIMIGQSETGINSQIIFITLFSSLENGGRYGISERP